MFNKIIQDPLILRLLNDEKYLKKFDIFNVHYKNKRSHKISAPVFNGCLLLVIIFTIITLIAPKENQPWDMVMGIWILVILLILNNLNESKDWIIYSKEMHRNYNILIDLNFELNQFLESEFNSLFKESIDFSQNLDVNIEKIYILIEDLYNFAKHLNGVQKYFFYCPTILCSHWYSEKLFWWYGNRMSFCDSIRKALNDIDYLFYCFQDRQLANFFSDPDKHKLILLDKVNNKIESLRLNQIDHQKTAIPEFPHKLIQKNTTKDTIIGSPIRTNQNSGRNGENKVPNGNIIDDGKEFEQQLRGVVAVSPNINMFLPEKLGSVYSENSNAIDAKEIGEIGELIVFQNETERLKRDHPDKLDKIEHSSLVKGDGLGYDIQSWDKNEDIFIEVKTTTGMLNNDFIITSNELQVARMKGNQYRLVIIYNLDAINNIFDSITFYGYDGIVEYFAIEENEIYLLPKKVIK